MNKNYILNREELKNVIMAAKSYIANICREMISKGQDPTKLTRRETDKIIDEFIDSLPKMKVDVILDKVDEVLLKTTGLTSRDFKYKEEKNGLEKQ
jgi:hypothetical protein